MILAPALLPATIALAVWLLLPRSDVRIRRGPAPEFRPAVWRTALVLGPPGVAAWLFDVGAARWWIGVLGAGVIAVFLRRLFGQQRTRREREIRRRWVVEFCDALVSELHGGLPAPAALDRACAAWPDLAHVAAAGRLDGDVAGLLRSTAQRPGGRGLMAVATAWEVAGRSGTALAVVLERVSVSLRHEADAAAEVTAALGPPRATARMLAVLPAFGLALGVSMGADPFSFLFSTTTGLGCLVLGVVLALVGLLWVERLATAAEE